jgi:hypothetical protein
MLWFAHDSALEEKGFELVVPPSEKTAAPKSPFGFRAGCKRLNPRKRRLRVSRYAGVISGRVRSSHRVVPALTGEAR